VDTVRAALAAKVVPACSKGRWCRCAEFSDADVAAAVERWRGGV